jgi:hypothetical protein
LTNQKNIEALIRNLEVQVGQLSKQPGEQHSRQFLANTQTNPREHCKEITTRSGKVIGRGISDHLEVEEEVLSEKEKDGEKNKRENEKMRLRKKLKRIKKNM